MLYFFFLLPNILASLAFIGLKFIVNFIMKIMQIKLSMRLICRVGPELRRHCLIVWILHEIILRVPKRSRFLSFERYFSWAYCTGMFRVIIRIRTFYNYIKITILTFVIRIYFEFLFLSDSICEVFGVGGFEKIIVRRGSEPIWTCLQIIMDAIPIVLQWWCPLKCAVISRPSS